MEKFLHKLTDQAPLITFRILVGLLIFVVFWLAGTVLAKTIRRIYDKADPGKKDIINLFGQTVKAGLMLFGAVTGLGTMGVNVSALVAGLGLTGFALGFALRDALANLLAGLLILIYRPFERNDRVSVSGFEGTVIGIDLRYTTIQAEGKKVLIPNSSLFTQPISLLDVKPATEGNPSEPGHE